MQTDDYAVVREWAQGVMDNPWQEANSRMRVVAKTLLDLLPKMTMADIGWEHDLHHLAGATTPDGKEVVMMWLDDVESGLVMCSNEAWLPEQLTPNGKRYELREVTVSSNENVGLDQPEHPETLTTGQDYKDAPVGTIATYNGYVPSVKLEEGVWSDMFNASHPNWEMAAVTRKVLRWGWGK